MKGKETWRENKGKIRSWVWGRSLFSFPSLSSPHLILFYLPYLTLSHLIFISSLIFSFLSLPLFLLFIMIIQSILSKEVRNQRNKVYTYTYMLITNLRWIEFDIQYMKHNLFWFYEYFLSFYLSTFLPFYLSIFLPFYIFTFLPFYLSIFLSFYLSIFLPFYLSTLLSFYLFTFLPFYLSNLLTF